MTTKQIIPRKQAQRDVDDVIAHYLGQAAERAAMGSIDALEEAYAHISCHPSTSSPRYAHELNLPSLRFWPLTRYPHLVFCGAHQSHRRVARIARPARHPDRGSGTKPDLIGTSDNGFANLRSFPWLPIR